MKGTKIKSLKPGMVVEQDVKDLTGRVLLTSGSTILEKHIKIFKSWGITEVFIKGIKGEEESPPPVNKDVDPELLKNTEKEMTVLFSHVDMKHPAINELYNLCVLRKFKMVSGQGGGNE